MKDLKEDMVDLIVADIPYNTTNNYWDKFESNQAYLDFLGEFIFECGRVLKETGSLYVFHNDFDRLCDINDLVKNNSGLKNRNLIVWNKRFNGCNNEYLKDVSLCRESLNNYPKYAEYILFYTFEEKKKNETVQSIKSNFEEYKQYIQGVLLRNKMTWNSKEILNVLQDTFNYKSMQSTKGISQRLFSKNFKGFGLITKKQYEVLNPILMFDKTYDELVYLYNIGKQKAVIPEKQKRIKNTFNNLASHHSVWNYDLEENTTHPTQKPKELIKNIILYSSNEKDLILDPFFGSGVTIDVCKENNRNYIGFELDKSYFDTYNIK
jgi:adenine-specific DNA-methyltransferase